MAYDLSKMLVVAISSRALFDLARENKIYQNIGIAEYRAYQIENEDVILKPGTGFHLVKGLLRINEMLPKQRQIEVVIVSRNSPDVSLRIWNSITHHGLDITRGSFTCGEPIGHSLLKNAYGVDLFLSAESEDVHAAFQANVPAARVYGIPTQFNPSEQNQVRVAFDGDAVVFEDASERVFQEQSLSGFMEHEAEKAREPLGSGPFGKLFLSLAYLQAKLGDAARNYIRLGIITARNSPAHERVIRTLRAWQIHDYEIHFLGGQSKGAFLEAFNADIFFDDQSTHCVSASDSVPTAQVYSNLFTESEGDSILCPRCGAEMVERTATKGPYKGKPFWGCSNYSIGCRCTRSIA